MASSFASLPIVDLGDLSLNDPPSATLAAKLSEQLYDVFATTGFAYLTNAPLSFDHDTIFRLARSFFELPKEHKMRIAKKAFKPDNSNTYRGYFPVQPLNSTDNLKEGLEIGSPHWQPTTSTEDACHERIRLNEPNVWPDVEVFSSRSQLERLYDELQQLSSRLLSLLAISLGKDHDFFDAYLCSSLSTLRLLHYPLVHRGIRGSTGSVESFNSAGSALSDISQSQDDASVQLSCTPHTDSGILTLLHQDATGGLEVRNNLGQWVPAPYIPGSVVVNIGDLMAEVSRGRFVTTMHRVRSPGSEVVEAHQSRAHSTTPKQLGRFSVPFFFEPGEDCLVKSVDGGGHGVLYGEHVRQKMKTFVEFQGIDDSEVVV